MSASLVGSEMCIRDSCAVALMLLHKILGAQETVDEYIDLPERDTEKPVSYTHLTLPTICSV
eukprot:14657924-Alexandrium_andersonii.AAC.1